MHQDAAVLGMTLAGQGLDQLALAVAGDAGHADDLAGPDIQRQPVDRALADIVGDRQAFDAQHRLARHAGLALDQHAGFAPADHHLGHGVVVELGGRPRAHELAAAQHRHRVAEGIHLAELVSDGDDGELLLLGELLQRRQHLVGLVRRQHRGRLVEDQQVSLQIKLAEYLALLLLAGGEVDDRDIAGHGKGRGLEERLEGRALGCPVDDRRQVLAAQHEILQHRHVRHQSEVLVDHAQPQLVRLARMADRDLAAVEQHLALVGGVVAHRALHQRALAGTVLAQQRMEGTSTDLHRDVVERRHGAEALGKADQLERRGRAHAPTRAIASITAAELATAPNTPPCISTIFSAAR